MPEQPTDPAGNPAGNSGGPHYGGPYDRNGSPSFDGPRNSGPSFDGFTPGRGAADDAADDGQSAPHHPDPEQPGLVPPMRVMRRRLDGVYRADGFAGPTRRYVLIVALLVGLASLPTLAAITAGTATMDEGRSGAMDVPFLPQPSDGPVVRPTAPTSAPSLGPLPGGAVDPAGTSPAPPATGPAGPPGADGPSATTPAPARGQAQPQGTAPARPGGASSGGDADAGRPESGGRDRPRPPASDPGRPSRPSEPRPVKPRPDEPRPPAEPKPPTKPPSKPQPPSKPEPPSRPKPPSNPRPPADRPGRPGWCHERGACWVKPAHHQRPDRTPHRHCDQSAQRSENRHRHHRQRREERGMSQHQHRSAHHRQHAAQHRHRSHDGPRNDRWSDRTDRRPERTGNAHRSRTFDRREFRVADRPHNSYRSGTADRTHNGRRIATAERSDSTQATSWSYRGSHRSERSHHTDNDRPAGRHSRDQHRSESGRHHHRGHFGDHNGPG